jgi:6,7-dimethyl-8-ribityllumazine synthase
VIKAIHIGRALPHESDLRALVEFFDAIGLEEDSSRRGEGECSYVFSAPEGKICLGWSRTPGETPPEDLDLKIEVTDPDAVREVARQRGLRIVSEQEERDFRLFVVQFPGGSEITFFGRGTADEQGIAGKLDASGKRFGIVVSRFNSFITERLLAGALDGLRRTGARDEDISIVRVPGSFEIPAAARTLAQSGTVAAVVCLGCLLRGDTVHFDVIANEVARGTGQSAQETGIPHAFGVLTCDTLEQAIERAGLKGGNKGFEAALAAVEMASLKETISRG